jgi:hypothetical protein
MLVCAGREHVEHVVGLDDVVEANRRVIMCLSDRPAATTFNSLGWSGDRAG